MRTVQVGQWVGWWAGKEIGWIYSRVISVSALGYPTVWHPTTGKKKQLRCPVTSNESLEVPTPPQTTRPR